ncbi:hypothetical protein OF83DRAFT_1180036 [Amylostereum chailletii]|nr:hypothetical protein OF83DRAFT_1180036 [Amylostereum chailletii]
MVSINWHDPAVITADFETFIRLQHVVGGIYIWEFVNTLNYDWSYVIGERPWTWTMWERCRLSILASVIIIFIGFDSTSEINCEAWSKLIFIFPYLGVLFASILMGVRGHVVPTFDQPLTIAIWNRNIYVIGLTALVLLAQVGVLVRSVVVASAKWDPSSNTCFTEDTAHSLPVMSTTLASDVVLLLCMFTGLLRHREARGFGMCRLLWNQGLVWIAAAVVAEVPTVVFLILDLNDAYNLMFQPSEMIILAIAATSMYRTLTNFVSGRIEWTFTEGPAIRHQGLK